MKRIKIILVTCLLFQFFIPNAIGENMEEIIIDKEIKTIELNMNGDNIINFEVTDDIFRVSDLKLKNIDYNPLKIRTIENKLILELKPKAKDHFSNWGVDFNLELPKNKEVKVYCGNCRLSGHLEAKSLDVRAGVIKSDLNLSVKNLINIFGGLAILNLRVNECKIFVSSGANSTGTIYLPHNTIVSGIPFWSSLKIVRER